MRKSIALLLGFLAALVVVSPALALGIGLGCGFKFDLGSVQKGQSYHVGQMCILNTNPESTCFRMDVSYLYQQAELQVPKEWVRFEPETFCLEPCEKLDGGYRCPFDAAQKVVQIYLDIPQSAKFDDYFALLEGCTDTGSYVGVCVAAKLMFTIEPKGWWQRLFGGSRWQ